MMRNYFWFGTTIPEFLFDGFDIKTRTGFVFMCFGLLSVALLLERIKLFQKYSKCKIVVRKAITSESPEMTISEDSRSPETQTSSVSYGRLGQEETTPMVHRSDYLKSAWPRPLEHIVDTASFTVVEILDYALMLCAMLYNGFFVLSIIFGSSFGYFLFGQRAYELTVIAGIIGQKGKRNQLAEAEQQGRQTLSIAARDMLNVVSTSSNTVSSIGASGHDNQEEENSDEAGISVCIVNA